jgi:hypothetical protein
MERSINAMMRGSYSMDFTRINTTKVRLSSWRIHRTIVSRNFMKLYEIHAMDEK